MERDELDLEDPEFLKCIKGDNNFVIELKVFAVGRISKVKPLIEFCHGFRNMKEDNDAFEKFVNGFIREIKSREIGASLDVRVTEIKEDKVLH